MQSAGSSFHHLLLRPLILKSFKHQNLNPEIGSGSVVLSTLGGTTQQIRTATKMAISLNGSSQYASKATPSALSMNDSEALADTGFESTNLTRGGSGTGNHVPTRVNDGDVHGGSWAVEVVASAAGNAGNDCVYKVPTLDAAGSGKLGANVYTFEFWAKSISGATGLTFYATGNDSQPAKFTLTTSWKKFKYTVGRATEGNVYPLFYLDGAGTFRIDDFSITRAYDFSIIAWVKSSTNAQAYKQIALVQSTTTRFGIQTDDTGVNQIIGNIYDEQDNIYPSVSCQYADGNWHLIVLSCDRDGNAIMYADGVAGTPVSMMSTSRLIGTSSFTVGATGTGTSLFSGFIGEVQIVKGVLTSEEIGYVYQYGVPDSWSGSRSRLGHYKWDSNGTDETSQNNTLTLSGSPTISASDYTQYATYNSDGSIRLWGCYCRLANQDLTLFQSSYAVLLTFKPLHIYNTTTAVYYFVTEGSSSRGIRYDTTNDKLTVVSDAQAILDSASAFTGNSDLQTKKSVIYSASITAGKVEMFVEGGKRGELTSGIAARTITNMYLGYTSMHPLDVYQVAIFPAAINQQQAIGIDNAYKFAV